MAGQIDSMEPTSKKSKQEGKFTVYIHKDEKERIKEWVEAKPDIETGGDLFGLWIDKHKAVVQFVLGPGEQCRRTTTSFFQDISYLRDSGSYLTEKHGLCNIGQWHSHHKIPLFEPSAGDNTTVWSNMPTLGLERYIVFIANIRSSHDVTVNSFLFEMRNGEQLPVMKGSFEELQGESPFRLNSDVMKTVRVGAESLREVKHVHEFEKKSPRRKDTKPESQGDTGTQKEKEMATRTAWSIESNNSKTEGRKDNSEHDESSREIYSNNDNNKDSSTKVDTVTANNSNIPTTNTDTTNTPTTNESGTEGSKKPDGRTKLEGMKQADGKFIFEIGLPLQRETSPTEQHPTKAKEPDNANPNDNHTKEKATISEGDNPVTTQLTSNEEPSTPPTNNTTSNSCSTTPTNTTTTTDNNETGQGPQKEGAPKVDTVAAINSNNDNSNIPTTNVISNTNTTNTPTTNESGTKQGSKKPDAPTKEGQREDSKDSFSNAAESTSLQTQSNNEDSSNSPQQDATTEQHSTTANKSENVNPNPNGNHKEKQAPISEGDKIITTQPKTSHSSGEHPLANDSSEQRNRKTPGLLCCFHLCRSNR